MAHVHCVVNIEVFRHGGEVVPVMVHVVPVAGLRGPTVTAPIVSNHAVSILQKEHHLGVPVIGRKRPTVAEYDRLARSPVLVEDLRAI